MALDDRWFLKSADLGKLFGRSERSIQRWLAKWGDKIRARDGTYYLPDVIAAREADLKAKGRLDKNRIDAELKLQRTKLLQLQYEARIKELLPRAQVEQAWATRAAELKQGLIALEFRLSGLLADKTGRARHEVQEILRNEIRELLTRYVRDGEYTPRPTKDLPIELVEEAYEQFWNKLMALANKPKPPARIDVKLIGRRK